MRSRIESYIPRALEAVRETEIADRDGIVPSQYNGYIASFGASIRQAGLVATVLFYENSSGSEQDRSKVIKAIEYILDKKLVRDGKAVVSRDEVDDAAVALKLAVRTFKMQKD